MMIDNRLHLGHFSIALGPIRGRLSMTKARGSLELNCIYKAIF